MSKAARCKYASGAGRRVAQRRRARRCAASVIPGVGQLINGETDKAIGVFVVAAATGARSSAGCRSSAGRWPGLGATWLYGVADVYVQSATRWIQGRKK